VVKKTEFLEQAIARFLPAHPAWVELVKDKRGLYFAAGRELAGAALVYIDFSVRPDRFVAGHGVGWTTSTARFHASLKETVNRPFQPREGRLERVRSLENPRDFLYEEFRIPTAQLCKPFGGFDLTKESSDEVLATIATEIEEYALPYLCLMLLKRHSISVAPEQLSSGPVT
jgi:hypothetical protein